MLGLARALAQAGAGDGIKVNLIAPMAMTRTMSTGMDLGDQVPDVADRDPALVAPLVALLCHESCPVTGEAFVSGCGACRACSSPSPSATPTPGTDLTPEIVSEHWDEIFRPDHQAIVPDVMTWGAANESFRSAVALSG